MLILPRHPLASTDGGSTVLADERGTVVVFVHPRISPPEGAPAGWDEIPGARGCTAESRSFRDLAADFGALDVRVIGLSSQSPEEQREAHARLHLGYPLVSDEELHLRDVLNTIEVEGRTLYQRCTLILDEGVVAHRIDDITDPEAHPSDVLRMLAARSTAARRP
ncbi:peroxiredoxin [Rathayibacter tanaceti]|uniref:Peroxiredoxin n=2 Tax=Rathayibacter tanaceti TaxID=1671680 RepID=A0ACD2XPL4_9MICO|nr:peroxiredoxin [Rathayibacter tanaceti]KZX22797.1 putative peroxiredoxin/MT2597 [Rathayibacter tanaceti]QHC55486.1 redoxin family protein [Rathayibacter tanaceti]TCO39741.1 peroxiredoxin [Rathayibacter tanaceti]